MGASSWCTGWAKVWGFGELIASTRRLTEGRNTQLPLADLLHQSGYSGMEGYEDVNDAERLSTRSDVPADRFGEDLGPWGGATSRLQSYTSQDRKRTRLK